MMIENAARSARVRSNGLREDGGVLFAAHREGRPTASILRT